MRHWRRPSCAGLIPARAGKTSTSSSSTAPQPAHPRACGENLRQCWRSVPAAGSSPRVRGKRSRPRRPRPRPGLIPARAGKTRGTPRRRPWPPAHPRACGENRGRGSPLGTRRGSSPRVRGKRSDALGQHRGDRLIPARAGKTRPSSDASSPSWAHPRACGENFTSPLTQSTALGSSPRVRGKQQKKPPTYFRYRLIPARAGKTGVLGHPLAQPWAHPRACGENGPGTPRVQRFQRLIPARAGKTRAPLALPKNSSAHPRACGENPCMGRLRAWSCGSSPRVRGKLQARGDEEAESGLIPARAGKTARTPPHSWSWRAHPRACGENDLCL